MNINKKIKDLKGKIYCLTKNYYYTEDEINLILVAYLAISSIDNYITYLLDDVLSNVYILFRFKNKKLTKILKSHNLDKDNTYHLEINDLEKNDKYKLIVVQPQDNTTNLLKALIHELKHAINGVIDKYTYDGKVAVFYSGLAKLKYGINENNQIQKSKEKTLLEETFNSFMTKIYMEVLTYYKDKDIQDEKIKTLINNVNMTNYKYTYYSLTKSMEHLFLNKDIFNLFYNGVLYKNFTPLKKKLHEICEIEYEETDKDILDLLESELRLINSKPALANVITLNTIKENIKDKNLSFTIRFENI